ncbi:MAG TPA: glycosidase [Bacteroidota bacterium]|nr:glycosidase [Bacteroidota bacterium]
MNTWPETPIRVERLHGGKLILERIPSHPWESKVTFNPACALVSGRETIVTIIEKTPFDRRTKETLAKREALVFLLYRAQGATSAGFARSSLGLAVLSPGLELLARQSEPVVLPDQPYDDLGVEDGRITKVGDRYILFYTAYGSGTPKNRIRIAIASTRDFVRWKKHGLLRGAFNTIDNKNAMLFEHPIGGKHVMLHRPMEGENAMSIHWAESDDIFGEWKTRGVLLKPIPSPEFADTWIGGGAPPLQISDNRYLMLYHIGNRGTDATKEYDLGIAEAEWKSGSLSIGRNGLLMRPETQTETRGDADLGVNNVLFVCGAYFYDGDLYFPYAGADSVVLGGKIPRTELDRFLAR